MTDNEVLEKVKADLRFDFNDLDADVSDNISAALIELGIAGVKSDAAGLDMLTLRAVKLYCRWQYNFDGRGEQYEKAFKALKTTLSLDTDHRESEQA